MKKFIAMLLALVMVFTVTACGSKKTEKPADFKAEAEAMSVTNSAIVTEFGLSAN